MLWGARRGALVVADPRKLRRTKCACWPHEVLAALGIGGDHPAAPWLRVPARQRAEDAVVEHGVAYINVAVRVPVGMRVPTSVTVEWAP